MKKRTISAIILLTIMISCFVIDSKLFGILIGILSILGFKEFFEVKYQEKNKKLNVIKILGVIFMLAIEFNNTFYEINTMALLLLPLLALTLPVVIYNDNKLYSVTDAFFLLGIIYILGFAFGNIVLLRDTKIASCIFIFVIAFITDTYAYIGGSLIGRHKLTTISPKKTIEGTVVGTVMGTLISTVYYYNLIGGMSLFETIIFCLILTVLSEFGDLIFSSIKRCFEKKDYSNLIPGHGGVLDRFDSVIYVSIGLLVILGLM